MILDKLKLLKLEAKSNIYKEQNRLITIKTIQDLLEQIDFNVELVPIKDKKKLTVLLISLKGRILNEEESELLKRIIE